MTPKEQARNLVAKFAPFARDTISSPMGRLPHDSIGMENAKQCALIAVEEIVNSNPVLPLGGYESGAEVVYATGADYWRQVRIELEKV